MRCFHICSVYSINTVHGAIAGRNLQLFKIYILLSILRGMYYQDKNVEMF